MTPIRSENRARYPKDWRAISDAIRFGRAEGRCECRGECGIDHGRSRNYGGRCVELHGRLAVLSLGKVILTVAHLDHTPENCDPANLRAMCRRCHNRYDAPMRRANRKKRLAQERGVLELPLEAARSVAQKGGTE